ncbi:MAG TPA: hypothetical protein VD973_04685 [Symbiobacteriaceae bacterium]|nr:hypothetical protein [Symbiobacteriaceae bacterium]
MGIKKVQGTTRPVDYTKDRQPNVKNPMLLIYADGRAQMSVRCKDLLAITAVTTQALMDQVLAVAEGVKDPECWTKEDVAALCDKVGRTPFPTVVEVEHLEGQGSLLMRVPTVMGSSVAELSYPKGSNRPSFNLLPALKDENIRVPEDMCLEVPVALVMDRGMLKVEAKLTRGKERAVKKEDNETKKDPEEEE